MATAKQTARRERIEAAAYEVLKECGYKGASLLAVARQASASNETLYNWYGNKQSLYRSLIEANANVARHLLEAAHHRSADPVQTLAGVGPVLLSLVMSEKAVTLNRAAAADVSDSGALGQAIGQFGRDTIAPLLGNLIHRAAKTGAISCDDPAEAADIYIRLLIGDLQIRRVIATVAEMTPSAIKKRSQQALTIFLKIYPPGEQRSEAF